MDATGAIVFCQREGGSSPMLAPLLFSPAALWLSASLQADGVTHFFVVCHADDRAAAALCFPPETEVVTDGTEDATARLSAFLAAQADDVIVVTRPVLLLPEEFPAGFSGETTGLFCLPAAALAGALDEGAAFEESLQKRGTPISSAHARPLRRGACWMEAEQLARQMGVARLVAAGVRLVDPAAVYIDPTVTVGAGTVLLPGTILRGKTVLGADCEIGPNSMIRDCTVGDRVLVNASQLNECVVEDEAKIGPFAYLRPHCHVGRGVKVGDFVELKNTTIGAGTKISHLTYVGDADVGARVNFGCGTVTVNYDGDAKFRTVIGDDAFIGCNTNLVAPVEVGAGAYTAAGSTITDNVPCDSLAIARSQQVVKKQWAARRRGKRRMP